MSVAGAADIGDVALVAHVLDLDLLPRRVHVAAVAAGTYHQPGAALVGELEYASRRASRGFLTGGGHACLLSDREGGFERAAAGSHVGIERRWSLQPLTSSLRLPLRAWPKRAR